MKGSAKSSKGLPDRDTLMEAYEVRAFRNETEQPYAIEPQTPEIEHAEPGAFQAIKAAIRGHGEQRVLPDDCQFGDNDLCAVEA